MLNLLHLYLLILKVTSVHITVPQTSFQCPERLVPRALRTARGFLQVAVPLAPLIYRFGEVYRTSALVAQLRPPKRFENVPNAEKRNTPTPSPRAPAEAHGAAVRPARERGAEDVRVHSGILQVQLREPGQEPQLHSLRARLQCVFGSRCAFRHIDCGQYNPDTATRGDKILQVLSSLI